MGTWELCWMSDNTLQPSWPAHVANTQQNTNMSIELGTHFSIEVRNIRLSLSAPTFRTELPMGQTCRRSFLPAPFLTPKSPRISDISTQAQLHQLVAPSSHCLFNININPSSFLSLAHPSAR